HRDMRNLREVPPECRAVVVIPRICVRFFFFKQKTAYEIGLGIPAEPLFRSALVFKLLTTYIPKTSAFTLAFSTSQRLRTTRASRSEERRVGKEGRCRGSPCHAKKKSRNDSGSINKQTTQVATTN